MIEVPDDFSGAVSVSTGAHVEFEQAYGLADRAHGIAATVDTRFAVASATKAFTALTVISLIADGVLSLDSPVRTILGSDLPLIADDVTIEHLLTHRSGIGDYVDEDLEEELPLNVPVQQLDSAEAYLPALDGFPAKFPTGTRFSYCNGGFAVLAIVSERAAGAPFADLATHRVWQPAGMAATGFLRSDALPGNAAIGYLDDGRTNVFALPVLGTGDGGAFSTVADLRSFWAALFAGRIGAEQDVARMTAPYTTDTGNRFRYGMGFWLAGDGPVVVLEGADHGVSFRSWHDPSTGRTATVVSNTSDGAWPVARTLARDLAPLPSLPA
jgi:CubicO group peptidase (beta-lactamase class C family)